MGKPRNAISPTREEDYPEWYQQVVKAADLAENTPVRGCMVIKPWGYGIWENIRDSLDKMFKDTGCLLYTSPSPRDVEESRMPSSA